MHRRDFLATAAAATLATSVQARAAESSKKLRVGVIGHTGRGNYGHGLDTMWLEVPETEIVAIADPDPSGLAAELKKLNVSQGFEDYRKLLREVRPEIVAIGMRHIDQHRDVALAAIEAGARGIYIEKPFCRTPAEADEIVAACEAKNAKLAIAHRNRYHPILPVISGLVKDGAIGKLVEMRARGKEDPRGGSLDLYVLGSHLLNLINYFGGQPLACTATVLQDGRPVAKADVKEGAEGIGPLAGNEVHARYEMECGVSAFFDSIHDAGTKQAGFGLQLIGTKGVIDLRVDQDPVAHLVAGNPYQPTKDPRAWTPISTAGVGQPEPIANLGKQVMNHLLSARDLIAAINENRQPLCSVYEGRTTIEMIAAVFESHRHHGQRITFPLQARGNALASLT
jgi:predicted dehydrogenase